MRVSDLSVAIGMFVFLGIALTFYLGRTVVAGRARHARTDADGGSIFMHKAAMEMGYWMLAPFVNALAAVRITPSFVTFFSLVPALLAAIAAARGQFGLACLLGTVSSLCDLVDGVLARQMGVASEAGEVLDAAVDRYVEFALLAGVAVYFRESWMLLGLTLLALFGSLMTSHTTALAEARSARLPRSSSMRRAERAVYLLVAMALTPVTRSIFGSRPSHVLPELPIIAALLVIAVVTNVAVARRFMLIALAPRRRL